MNEGTAALRSGPARVAFLAIVLGGCLGERPHASDTWLKSNFGRHRSSFDALLRLAKADPQLNRVAPDFVWNMEDHVRDPRRPKIDPARWDEYKRLFRETRVHEGLLRPAQAGDLILFISTTQGFVTGGTSKGYAYSATDLSPLVSSLDEPDKVQFGDNAAGERAFVRLEAGWYLYFDRS